MRTYTGAIREATQLCNIPNPESDPSKFIYWSEDICGLIAYIYEKDYEQVVEDFQEALGILEEDDEDTH